MISGILKKVIFLSIALLMIANTDAEAQDCSQILQHGIWEHSGYGSDEQRVSSFLNWYNRDTSIIESSSQDINGNATVVYQGIPIELGIEASEDNSRNFIEQLQTLSAGNTDYSRRVVAFSNSASEAIVNAWERCISNSGFHVSIRYTLDPKEFWVLLRLTKDSPATPDVQLAGLDLPENVSCGDVPNQIRENEVAVRCTRSDNRAISIGIEADRTPSSGSAVFIIDALSEKPAEPPLPPIRLELFEATGATALVPTAAVSLPDGHKLIAGGARNNWSGQGNLLTALYPENETTWVAKGKAHSVPDEASLTVWAIGLNDPNDDWEVRIFQNTSTPAHHPATEVAVPEDYLMTGGGARVNWSDQGNLLTASFPSNESTWTARSKDHSVPDVAAITVFAIGIKPRNGARLPETKIFQKTSDPDLVPGISVSASDDFVALGGGASVQFSGPGNLLTASHPDSQNRRRWTVASKAHSEPDVSTITAYVIGIRAP